MWLRCLEEEEGKEEEEERKEEEEQKTWKHCTMGNLMA
jgi:hypothetical protein